MKASAFFKSIALLMAMPLAFSACHTHKVNQEPVPVDSVSVGLVTRVDTITTSGLDVVSSKLKFSVAVGDQQLSLTGNLRMRRNDVIRLQLMAFGFVEAARIEFTQDYVLIIDRINKQYLMAPYYYIEFMRKSGINFHTLQALFWNELFAPGEQDLHSDAVMSKFHTEDLGDGESIISYEDGNGNDIRSRMFYSWLVNTMTGRIKMSNILYRDDEKGNYSLNWDYREYKPLTNKLFPSDMMVTLTLPQKEIKLGIKLNYLSTDGDWESRTRVSDKYREVDFEEILRRFMAL